MVAPYSWLFTIVSSTSTPTPTPTDPPGEQRTISLPVQSDTWVDDLGSVGPDGPTLWAGSYNYEEFSKATERTYLGFDASALAGKAIVTAELELWNNDAYGCGTSTSGIVAQQVTSAWNAETLTWDNQPPTTDIGQVVARDPGGCADDAPEVDVAWTWQVKDIVQTWASGQNGYGFMLRGVDESADAPMYDRGYHASEADTSNTFDPHPPVLKVTYIDDGGGQNPTPTPGPDTTAPTVIDVEPADSDEEVSPDAQVRVTFSEPVTHASLLLEDIFDGPLTGQTTMSADRRVLTFTPDTGLDSWYWVTVSGARDSAGNTMAEPYEWWFGIGSFVSMAQKQRAKTSAQAGEAAPSVEGAWTHTRKTADGAVVGTSTPELLVKTTGGKRRAVAEVEVEHDPAAPSQGKGLIWVGSAKSGAGSVGLVRVPTGKLSDGWKVRWRARATTGGVTGRWSGWQTFTVDPPASPSAPRVSAQAAEPAFSYDRIQNPAECRALTGPKAYAVKNSYNWCMWGEIGSSVTHTVNGRTMGSLRYDARITLIAHSFTGESKNDQARQANQYKSRQFKLFVYLDQVDRDGKSSIPAAVAGAKAAAQVFPFNLGLAFNPSNKCSVAPVGLNKFIYNSPEGWAQNGGNYTFTSNAADFAGPDHRHRCKLQPQVHMTEQIDDPYGYLMTENPVFRCDSSPAIKTSQGGCVVFKDGRPVFELSKANQVKGPNNQLITNPVKESAQHIWDAWNNASSTVPGDPGKQVPGATWNKALQRNTDTSRKGLGGENRKIAIKQCDISFSDPRPRPPGKRYTKKLVINGVTIVRSCDEFPFAASHQGASKAGTNYSARAILATDNSTSGSWLGWWFERNRVLEKQKFVLRISDSQQPGINGYYPPPPGTDTLADEQIVPDSEAP
ncbi:DNRLRE domain-containing protein [Streptosporangium subroseum]|nr:DNRLRE domain-containing protein [Streptosporangium subroseum]